MRRNILTRPATAERDPERDPEIDVPNDLEPYYAAALAAAQESGVTPHDNPYWKITVTSQARRTVALRYDGGEPGLVRRPTRRLVVDGEDNWGMDDEARAEWVRAYEADRRREEEYGPQFRSEVEELTDAILRDPHRNLRLHHHLLALKKATEVKKSAELREQTAADYTRKHTCPVCGQCDPIQNGAIKVRTLLDGTAPPPFGHAPATVRSCLACWHSAHRLHLAALSHIEDGEHGRTRDQVVTEYLRNAAQAS